MARTTIVEYRVLPDAASLAHATAQHLTAKITETVRTRGLARVAVSGGSTPRATFQLLADPAEPYRDAIDWSRLHLYFVDERCVPPDNPDSNYGMTRDALLSKVPLPATNVYRIEGELPPEEAAARYESAIRNSFRLEGAEAPRFDVIQLGMGPDGHTASLFPHTEALNELGRIAVANHVPQQQQSWRITLTWPVLLEAAHVFFLIAGQDKAGVLRRVLTGPYQPDDLPSQIIQPRNGQLLLLLDSEAANELPPVEDGQGRLEVRR